MQPCCSSLGGCVRVNSVWFIRCRASAPCCQSWNAAGFGGVLGGMGNAGVLNPSSCFVVSCEWQLPAACCGSRARVGGLSPEPWPRAAGRLPVGDRGRDRAQLGSACPPRCYCSVFVSVRVAGRCRGCPHGRRGRGCLFLRGRQGAPAVPAGTAALGVCVPSPPCRCLSVPSTPAGALQTWNIHNPPPRSCLVNVLIIHTEICLYIIYIYIDMYTYISMYLYFFFFFYPSSMLVGSLPPYSCVLTVITFGLKSVADQGPSSVQAWSWAMGWLRGQGCERGFGWLQNESFSRKYESKEKFQGPSCPVYKSFWHHLNSVLCW